MNRAGVVTAIEALDGDVANADSHRCADLLGDVRVVRGWLDAAEARITSRMTELHDSSGAAPAADLHTRCGGVSAAEGKRKERRSKTLDEAPLFGDALADGTIGAEHVDALANATSKLDEEVRASLLDEAPDLLGAATTMSPEQFSRHVRDRARRLERDNGIERNKRQRRETFLSRKVNLHTGMVEGRFAFHPELANQVFGAVDRQVAAMIAEGERTGDPAFVNRAVDRNRVAAEALGCLVTGGHQAVRPTEADITVIVDEQTAATRGTARPFGLRDRRRARSAAGVYPAPALQRANHADHRRRRGQCSQRRPNDPSRQPQATPSTAGDVPHLRLPWLRRGIRALRDSPSRPLGTRRFHRSPQSRSVVCETSSRHPRGRMVTRTRARSNPRDHPT